MVAFLQFPIKNRGISINSEVPHSTFLWRKKAAFPPHRETSKLHSWQAPSKARTSWSKWNIIQTAAAQPSWSGIVQEASQTEFDGNHLNLKRKPSLLFLGYKFPFCSSIKKFPLPSSGFQQPVTGWFAFLPKVHAQHFWCVTFLFLFPQLENLSFDSNFDDLCNKILAAAVHFICICHMTRKNYGYSNFNKVTCPLKERFSFPLDAITPNKACSSHPLSLGHSSILTRKACRFLEMAFSQEKKKFESSYSLCS